jgi:hypothetical protein
MNNSEDQNNQENPLNDCQTRDAAFRKKLDEHIKEITWQESEDPVGMIRWLENNGADRKILVKIACVCARYALVYIPSDDPRPLIVIETTEKWIGGKVEAHKVAEAAKVIPTKNYKPQTPSDHAYLAVYYTAAEAANLKRSYDRNVEPVDPPHWAVWAISAASYASAEPQKICDLIRTIMEKYSYGGWE